MKPAEYQRVRPKMVQIPNLFGKYDCLMLLPGAAATIISANTEPTRPAIKKGLILRLKSATPNVSIVIRQTTKAQLCITAYASEKPPAMKVTVPAINTLSLYQNALCVLLTTRLIKPTYNETGINGVT
jgi:hypothetical protein